MQQYSVHSGQNKYHLIIYMRNKSGFMYIFDELIPDDISGDIVDIFGAWGPSLYIRSYA